MKITTPKGTLESIEAILEKYGRDCLRDADLSGFDLSHADLTNANLIDADLSGADLIGANLTKANMSRACLLAADLRGANLTKANMMGADLRSADIGGADLAGADLHGAEGAGLIMAQTRILPDGGDIIGWEKSMDSGRPANHCKTAYPVRRATLQWHGS